MIVSDDIDMICDVLEVTCGEESPRRRKCDNELGKRELCSYFHNLYESYRTCRCCEDCKELCIDEYYSVITEDN
jgi:hypothetical protein